MVPMDEAKFSRIKSAFERGGGSFMSSDELDKYLAARGADAITYNDKLVIFRRDPPPTASEVFEELIHTAQFRQGGVSTRDADLLEIKAKEKLLRYQKQYGIPDHEHDQTMQQLKELKKKVYGEK